MFRNPDGNGGHYSHAKGICGMMGNMTFTRKKDSQDEINDYTGIEYVSQHRRQIAVTKEIHQHNACRYT